MNAVLQYVLYVGILVAISVPLGIYMSKVMDGETNIVSRVLGPVERGIYKLLRTVTVAALWSLPFWRHLFSCGRHLHSRILGVKKRLIAMLHGYIFDLGMQLPSDAQKRHSKCVNYQILSVVPSV